jgi:hypothetical protein
MNLSIKKTLFWTPRVLGLLFAGFVSLFALDVFGEGYGFWGTILALLMHLIPTGIILIALAIAWRREWVGGLVFVALGTWYLVGCWGRFPWSTYLIISGPLFLLGGLFVLDWVYRSRRQSAALTSDQHS